MARKKSIKSEPVATGRPRLIKKSNVSEISKSPAPAPNRETEEARITRLRKEWLADRDTTQAATSHLRKQLFS